MKALIVLLLAGLCYFTYCMVTTKPERAVYGFLLVWMLFPKYIQKLPVLGYLPVEGLRIFEVLVVVVAVTLLFACLFRYRTTRTTPPYAPPVYWFLVLFLITAATSYVSGLYLTGIDTSAMINYELRDYVRPTLEMLYGVIFCWGCIRFIDKLERVEILFGIFVLSGLELIAEVVLLYYRHWVPYLDPWVLDSDNTNRFNSLAFLSYDAVGLVSIVNGCCALYFALTRRKWWMFALLPLFMLPIVATLQKAPFTAAILAAVVALSLSMTRHRRAMMGWGLAIVLSSIVLQSSRVADIPGLINRVFGGAYREDINVEQTMLVRAGQWLRGVDIFVHDFPLGAGNGLTEFQMAAEVPLYFENHVDGRLYEAYTAVASKEHITNVHNGFLCFIVENGLLGVVTLGLFIFMLARQFRRFLRTPPPVNENERRIWAAQGCLYGILFGLSWRFIYESGEMFYFMLFMILMLTFALPHMNRVVEAGSYRLSPRMSKRSARLQQVAG